MDTEKMLETLYKDRFASVLHDHESDFIENMHKKIIYSRRNADPAEAASIKKLYQIYLTRKMKI